MVNKLCMLCLVIFVMTGCGGGSDNPEPTTDVTTTGRIISDEELCKFSYNVTTPEQVIEALGIPDRRSIGTNSEFLYYEFREKSGIGADTVVKLVTTSFDFFSAEPEGILVLTNIDRSGNIELPPLPDCLK